MGKMLGNKNIYIVLLGGQNYCTKEMHVERRKIEVLIFLELLKIAPIEQSYLMTIFVWQSMKKIRRN